MKNPITNRATFLFALCVLPLSGFTADAPTISRVESLIISIPSETERQTWRGTTAEKNAGWSAAVIARMEGATGNINKLQAILVVGKSITEYPGILTLGRIDWDGVKRTYTLHVLGTELLGGGYMGFDCTFSDSLFIVNVEPVIQRL
jgi:hypothetical protein